MLVEALTCCLHGEDDGCNKARESASAGPCMQLLVQFGAFVQHMLARPCCDLWDQSVL